MIRLVDESKRPSAEMDEEAQAELRAIASYREALHRADEAIRDQVRRELADRAR
jgi:hypothetical protein